MYMTIAEIARLLQTSPSKATMRMKRAGIHKPGGRVMFEDIVEFVEKHSNSIAYDGRILILDRFSKSKNYIERKEATDDTEKKV